MADPAQSTVYYDPYDVGITADTYPTYARLRDEAPLYYNGRYDFWALSRHATSSRHCRTGRRSPTAAATSWSWSNPISTCPRA